MWAEARTPTAATVLVKPTLDLWGSSTGDWDTGALSRGRRSSGIEREQALGRLFQALRQIACGASNMARNHSRRIPLPTNKSGWREDLSPAGGIRQPQVHLQAQNAANLVAEPSLFLISATSTGDVGRPTRDRWRMSPDPELMPRP